MEIPFASPEYKSVCIDNYCVFLKKNRVKPRPYDPMENSMGNTLPVRVFHNRWTSPQCKVGTGCAIPPGGFGNPGLNRELGWRPRPWSWAQLFFDVTNLKKVGGSTTEPGPPPELFATLARWSGTISRSARPFGHARRRRSLHPCRRGESLARHLGPTRHFGARGFAVASHAITGRTLKCTLRCGDA